MTTHPGTPTSNAPPCPDCGVPLTDPSIQNDPAYPENGPLRQPTPYRRLVAMAEQIGAHVFDHTPEDITPELAAAIALRFDDHDHIRAIITLATDLDDDLRTDVLAYAIALYTGDPQRIANSPDAILTISRTRLPPTKHGPGHLARHLLHSCGRRTASASFNVISIK